MKQHWPALPYESWRDTYETLHLYTQIVGKIRMVLTTKVNHWWNVSFRVSSRGLTTTAIPYGGGSFTIDFDFIDHNLVVRTSEGHTRALALIPRSVAQFESDLQAILLSLGIRVIYTQLPCEIPGPVLPFSEDEAHASYDQQSAHDWWRILLISQRLMEVFRAGFIGKCSPVQFFWGGFDLAVSRFSGKPAPSQPGTDSIQREGYSHEVSSVGIWPGDASLGGPAFYAYHVPPPAGFERAEILPSQARWDREKGEFLLDYEDVRKGEDRERMVLEFFQSTYAAGADLANWDRQALERVPALPEATETGIFLH